MNEEIYTENQVNTIMAQHDEKWFKLLNKVNKRNSIILGILIGFIFSFLFMVGYAYLTTPPIKSQFLIRDNNGNVADIQQIEIKGE